MPKKKVVIKKQPDKPKVEVKEAPVIVEAAPKFQRYRILPKAKIPVGVDYVPGNSPLECYENLYQVKERGDLDTFNKDLRTLSKEDQKEALEYIKNVEQLTEK
jgi:hypothetical protein